MSGRKVFALGLVAAVVAVAGTIMAALMAILGAGALPCGGGTALAATGPAPTRTALREIPKHFLGIYREAGSAIDISWPFLASIGDQECGHGTGNCYVVNSSGCAGPMEIAYVRGSACSPDPSVPTIWERFRTDGDGDDKTSIFDPADAIFTAAKILRNDGAPPAGGSYSGYYQAACNYYGACSEGEVHYAAEVMARAVGYGFKGTAKGGGGGGEEGPGAVPVAAPPPGESGASVCGRGDLLNSGEGPMGPVHRATAPRHLADLPAPPAAYPGIQCDARIIDDVLYLTRRFGLLVTACYGIHATDGEHPLGAAIDAVPEDGDWSRTMRTALAIGWKPSCAASGVAPECARPPFRFIGYNGYPEHGDPAHCSPCGGGPHLHISWNTSASLGEPENRPRFTYEPAAWIEVFETGASGGADPAVGGPGSHGDRRHAKRGEGRAAS